MDNELVATSIPPEALPSFRRAQLLIILEAFKEGVTVDRLGYVEFFSANPFLIFRKPSAQRTRLIVSGFHPHTLSYQSSPERYANRRTRLRSDLGALVASGLVVVRADAGEIVCQLTDSGLRAAGTFSTVYVDALRLSVDLVRQEMPRSATNNAVSKKVSEWLRIEDLRIDLLDLWFDHDFDGQGVLI